MLGFFFGLAAVAAYVTNAVSGNWGGYEPGTVAVMGLAAAAMAVVLGRAAIVTVGITAMWAMFGAAVAGIIEFAQGNGWLGGVLLFHSVLYWGVQQVLVRAVESRVERLANPIGRSREHVASEEHQKVWRSVSGFYGVLNETLLDKGGPGRFTWYTDGSSRFETNAGVRWSFESATDWTGWRLESDRGLLSQLPGIDADEAVIVLKGPPWAMLPEVFVLADDVDAWVEQFETFGVPRQGLQR